MKNTKTFVDSLFSGYEETKNLADFKEELSGHLNEKIAYYTKKGLSEDEAFEKATAELGDISAIAEELSLQKKQEIYSEMYMGFRKYLSPKRTALFIFGGLLICLGFVTSALVFFATGLKHASLASGMVFIALGTGLLTFMGLTQETALHTPMSWKRALLYAVSVSVFCFGLLSSMLVYFAIITDLKTAEAAAYGWDQPIRNLGLSSAVGAVIAFILPSLAFFIFLALTEKDRNKPWAKQLREKEASLFKDPLTEQRFGMYSGAIWITAAALFILLGFLASFKISWLIFFFATAAQLCMQGFMIKKDQKE